MEVERSVRVLDAAVVLLDGVAGVEAQTEGVWRQASKNSSHNLNSSNHSNSIPRIIVANKMDRPGASFSRCLTAIHARLTSSAIPIQLPLYRDASTNPRFAAIVDLVNMRILSFDKSETGSVVTSLSASSLEDFRDSAIKNLDGFLYNADPLMNNIDSLWLEIHTARVNLVESLAALDDSVVESFLDSSSHLSVPADTVLKPALRRLTLAGTIFPVLCSSAFKNMGVQPVMDAIVDYLPAPSDRPPAICTIACGRIDDSSSDTFSAINTTTIECLGNKFCALAFKIIHDEKRGAMVFVRVYSGNAGYASQNVTERAIKILQMYADDYEEIPRISSGNIACILGLTETKTGDTLLIASEHGVTTPPSTSPNKKAIPSQSQNSPPASAVTLESIQHPPPVFIRSVEPTSSADGRKIESALAALTREDPSLVVTVDPDSGQTLLGGMGELHLEIAAERLLDTHKCSATMGKVSISYRETIPIAAGIVGYVLDYDKEIFGKHAKVFIRIRVEPIHSEKETAIETDEGGEWIIDVSDTTRLINIVDVTSVLDSRKMYPLPLISVPARNLAHAPTIMAPFGYPTISDVRSAARDGITQALARGPIVGFPVVNLRVVVEELKLERVETTSIAGIRAAAARCMRDVMRGVAGNSGDGGQPMSLMRLLEPIMCVTVTVPEKYVGTVTKDLTGTRRGNIVSLGTENGGSGMVFENHIVTATVPLGSLLGYSTSLRGMTAGTGAFSMNLLGYGRMSADREEAAIKELKGY
ncbi:Ribosome-releasing factor 2, mitochondrial [Physocladia obscura]|uniref:Ribosome-releasing factor 2, mitochondrial n=1 Tax=Physocladia obscura TaxID=109957 RepID=A0AAD5XCP3_9FUNG|nr:Ribosome-releasing factor 2, mitochondrial [Physocladia obscura]